MKSGQKLIQALNKNCKVDINLSGAERESKLKVKIEGWIYT